MQIKKFKPSVVLADGKPIMLSGRVVRTKAADGTRHDFELINNTKKPLKIARVCLFEMPLGKSAEIYRQGFYMPSDPAGFYTLHAGENVPVTSSWETLWDWWGDGKTFIAHSLAVVKRNGVALLTAGFVSFERFEGFFTFYTHGRTIRMAAWCLLENISLAPGAVCRLESVWIQTSRDFNKSVVAYANYIGQTHNAVIPRETVTGWVDWQYYREEKNERSIMRSVRAMQTLKQHGYPLKYVIIDGGWCAYASEWMKPCLKFPDIRRLCNNIRKAGFVPGLWLAPYITNVKTDVARRHPDWMVLDQKTGKPLFKERSNVGACNMLDFTVPEALDWLRKIVRMMVHDWGVGFIKLDGPNLSHYHGGRFHTPNVTTVEQVRESLRVIREECGDDVIVEGEGIYGPSIGFVDIQRTTQDTNTAWYNLVNGRPLLRENLKNDLLSGFLHGRLFHNHRENVVLRDFPSPFHAGVLKNPESKDSILTENQLQSQISATTFAGGAMLLSDPIPELMRSPRRLALISKFLPHFEGQPPAQPLDVFCSGVQPSIFHLPIEREFESWRVVGVFNWTDASADFDIPLKEITGGGAWHSFDFWNEEYLPPEISKSKDWKSNGILAVKNVPAHGCKVFALRRKLNHPQLIGTNLHILQGAVELDAVEYQAAKRTLRLTINHFDQNERRLFVWRPSTERTVDVKTNARDFLADTRQRNLVIIQFNGRQGKAGCRPTEFELKFGH